MTATSKVLAAEALARLGERLKLARTERHLRQSDLAELMGRARSTVSAIENGSPKVEMGAYIEALQVLGLLPELERLADPGRRYDVRHRVRRKAAKMEMAPSPRC